MLTRLLPGFRAYSSHTIFSKSSGSGKCGVAVIRVSGDKTKKALKLLTGCDSFKPRHATLKRIHDPADKNVIDNGIILYFPEPRSFTGEESCEFQVHGGPAVVSALLGALSKVDGLRPAEPGEFTKRAFFNGKMDLTEVEGLADLLNSETELQRKQALIQADGHLSKLYGSWRRRLIKNIAHIEAFIDFSEDENIEDGILDDMQKELARLHDDIQQHLSDGRKGELLRDGVRMVIVGETNVGKSSFMNALVQRDISIVTNIEGTTRDVIESHIDINGYPVVVADTAGLRESSDVVESEGIARARKRMENAEVIVVLIDGQKMEEKFLADGKVDFNEFRDTYHRQLGLQNLDCLEDKRIFTIVNKIDLMTDRLRLELKKSNLLGMSCSQSIRIAEVIDEISKHLKVLCGDPSAESPVLSQARHRHHLSECEREIDAFLRTFNPLHEQDFAILVQNLRNAVRAIARITGEVRTDDILDVIFKDFCIGK